MSRKLVVVLFALAMLSLANMACGSTGPDDPIDTAATEKAEAEAPVEVEVEVEVAEEEAQDGAQGNTEAQAEVQTEMSQETRSLRSDCFKQLPKDPSDYVQGTCPIGCNTFYISEFYGCESFSARDQMQKDGCACP